MGKRALGRGDGTGCRSWISNSGRQVGKGVAGAGKAQPAWITSVCSRTGKIMKSNCRRNLLLFLALLIAACAQQAGTDTATATPAPDAGEVIKGYGISPQGFPSDFSHFIDFLKEVGSLPNGGVMFNGAWRQRSEERRVGKECRSRWSPY